MVMKAGQKINSGNGKSKQTFNYRKSFHFFSSHFTMMTVVILRRLKSKKKIISSSHTMMTNIKCQHKMATNKKKFSGDVHRYLSGLLRMY